jgi:hypothetical protein
MKTIVSKTHSALLSSLRLAASFAVCAMGALRGAKRGLGVLKSERPRALLAASRVASPRAGLTEVRTMDVGSDAGTQPHALAVDRGAEIRSAAIQGQILRVSERREVAIYLRDDALWVADFIDGHGALFDAATWFRFNCGTPATSYARRRMVHESAVPLSTQLAARIQGLHRHSAVDASPERRTEPSVHEM